MSADQRLSVDLRVHVAGERFLLFKSMSFPICCKELLLKDELDSLRKRELQIIDRERACYEKEKGKSIILCYFKSTFLPLYFGLAFIKSVVR